MRIGPLRHRITIQKKMQGLDEYGGPIRGEWNDFAEVWASIDSKDGREYFDSQQLQSEHTERMRIRYNPDIDEKMRILYEGKIYDIVGVSIDNERTATVLTCKLSSSEQE